MKSITRKIMLIMLVVMTSSYNTPDNYRGLFLGLPYSSNKDEILEFIRSHAEYQMLDSFKGNFGSSYHGRIKNSKIYNSNADSIRFIIFKGYEFNIEGNKSFETFGTRIKYCFRDSNIRDSEFNLIVQRLNMEIGTPTETYYGDETSIAAERMQGYVYKLTSNELPSIGVLRTTETNMNELTVEFTKELRGY